jgi:hypothetical protein
MMFTNCTGIVLLFVLCGCVSVQSYPDNWDALSLAPKGACPPITGQYSNEGEGRYPQYPPKLAYQLLENRAKWRDADQVDIALIDSGKLLIRTRASGRLLNEFALAMESGQFSCDGGFLVLNKHEFVNREGAVGSRNSTVRIATSGERLIVREDVSEVGMLFLIPGASSYTNWARYNPIK